MQGAEENVPGLLTRLGLDRYQETFAEEEINDVSLLMSMGAEMVRPPPVPKRCSRPPALTPPALACSLPPQLRENLEELGLDGAAIDTLAGALFPGAEDDEVLELEENDAGAVPSGAAPGPALQPSVPVDALPDDLTQEEIDAAEAEAQWLLNPLSMLDLSETKEHLIRLMGEGNAYQKTGQFANARSVYTRAINMEAPNKRMNASLHYNRAACQRQLGQLKLALIDAQKAYALDPSMVKAYWRAADVAIILDEQEEAREAVEAGLKQAPRNGPLLQLKLAIQRF